MKGGILHEQMYWGIKYDYISILNISEMLSLLFYYFLAFSIFIYFMVGFFLGGVSHIVGMGIRGQLSFHHVCPQEVTSSSVYQAISPPQHQFL